MKRKPTNPITNVRTGTGDKGTTYLKTPGVPKNSAVVEFVGDLDEACAIMGKTKPSFDFGSSEEADFQIKLSDAYTRFHLALFEIGAMVHSEKSKEEHLGKLQLYVDEITELLAEGVQENYVEPLNGFIIPNEENGDLMHARSVVRRCERRAIQADEMEFVPFLNALSDFLFFVVWESSHYYEEWTGIEKWEANL